MRICKEGDKELSNDDLEELVEMLKTRKTQKMICNEDQLKYLPHLILSLLFHIFNLSKKKLFCFNKGKEINFRGSQDFAPLL